MFNIISLFIHLPNLCFGADGKTIVVAAALQAGSAGAVWVYKVDPQRMLWVEVVASYTPSGVGPDSRFGSRVGVDKDGKGLGSLP